MKKIIGSIAIVTLLVTGGAASVFAATPQVTVVGEPHVLLLQNEVCQEVIYTYLVEAHSTDILHTIKDVFLQVVDSEGAIAMDVAYEGPNPVAFVVDGEGVSVEQEVTEPCLVQTDYEMYSDNFEVEPGESEDFTVKIFFTPLVAGVYHSILKGVVFETAAEEETVVENKTSGGGKCLNCTKPSDDETIAVLGTTASSSETTLEEIEAMIAELDDVEDADMIEILSFVKLLISLGIL